MLRTGALKVREADLRVEEKGVEDWQTRRVKRLERGCAIVRAVDWLRVMRV